jgi:hypothetical protein
MCKLKATSSGAAMIALLLAGCGGGGGSDETAVSGAAEPPSPIVAAPDPAPPAPAPEPSPVAKVAGEVVWAALQTGISPDPNPTEPVSNYRKVHTGDNLFIYLGSRPKSLESHSFTTSPWGSLMKEGDVNVSATGSEGVIDGVTANDLDLVGPQLDLRNVDPVVDATAGTWTNGDWSAQLVIQSAESPDLMRVCWNVHLPPPRTVFGPPGSTPVVFTVPLKRLMCGVYGRALPGPDLGGYVEDDRNGTKRIFRGSWQD